MIEDDPFASREKISPAAFDSLSIEELEARILALKSEISLCEAAIAAKKKHLAAADSIFAPPKP